MIPRSVVGALALAVGWLVAFPASAATISIGLMQPTGPNTEIVQVATGEQTLWLLS